MRRCSESGQATVEAAVVLPAFFIMLGLFIQPMILMYSKSAMSAAASEGCRLVATNTSSPAAVKSYVRRRLGGIPQADVFHVGGSSWKISYEGPNEKGAVFVEIENRARPLPLFGVVAGLGNSIDKDGNVVQRVKVRSSCLPAWACKNGKSADEWIEEWA